MFRQGAWKPGGAHCRPGYGGDAQACDFQPPGPPRPGAEVCRGQGPALRTEDHACPASFREGAENADIAE